MNTTKRRSPLATSLMLMLLVATSALAQTDFEKVSIQRIDLAPGIAMLIGAGGNIGVSAGPDGVFLIDDQFAPLSEKIRAAILPLSDEPVRFVINTHWHADHTGGNENFGRAGAVIVAHDNVRRRMSTEQVMKALDRRVPASPAAALPVVTFDADVSFHLNGDEIRAFHVAPAHTDGDVVILWKKANIIHTGDTFVNGAYPFVDLSSGGDIDGIIDSGERVLALTNDETQIIPGHGPLAKRKDLEAFLSMLRATRAAIAAELEAGKSVDETVAAAPTANWDDEWGGGFVTPDRFTRFVYESLASRP